MKFHHLCVLPESFQFSVKSPLKNLLSLFGFWFMWFSVYLLLTQCFFPFYPVLLNHRIDIRNKFLDQTVKEKYKFFLNDQVLLFWNKWKVKKSEGRKERKKGGRKERRENDFIWLLQSFILPLTKKQTLNMHYKSLQIPEEWKEKSSLGFIIGWPHIPSNMLRHCFTSDSEGRLTHKYHFTT